MGARAPTLLTVGSSPQGRIADAAPQSTPHAATATLTRWFTRHLAGEFLLAAMDSRRTHHTAQAVVMEQAEQAEHAAQRPRREEFLEAYCGLMRAYDPPFLLVATAADEQLTVVLLRDVPVLSSFIAEMPYLQVKKNVHRLPIPIHTATRQGVSRPGRREGYLAACRGCGCWRGPGTSTRL